MPAYAAKSTSYMESRAAAERLAACFPRAKIVFVLRDPIDRAMSHYWFSVLQGTGSRRCRWRKRSARRGAAPQLLDPRGVGLAVRVLEQGPVRRFPAMYEDFFPRDRIAVLLYEEMVGTVDAVQRLYAFLGVDPRFSPAAGRRSSTKRHEPLERAAPRGRGIRGGVLRGSDRPAGRPSGRDLATWWRVGARKYVWAPRELAPTAKPALTLYGTAPPSREMTDSQGRVRYSAVIPVFNSALSWWGTRSRARMRSWRRSAKSTRWSS